MPAVHCVSFLSCHVFESCAHLACIMLHCVRQMFVGMWRYTLNYREAGIGCCVDT
jgi:hypothetical protein